MRNNFISIYRKWLFAILIAMQLLATSCVDKLTNDRIYTFKGEMVTDYLQNRKEQFSDFITVLQRAKIYDLLTTYGTYTCFAPTNTAMESFLSEKGLTAVSELSEADCDTLAYNHLIKITYFTTDLNDGVIPTTNMLDRYLSLSYGPITDTTSNVEYYINKASKIVLRDDSVENGVVHTIDRVLSTSNDLLPDMLSKDTTISLFYSAIEKTGFADQLRKYIDPTYSVSDDSAEIGIRYHTGNENETAYYPKVRKYKYTGFIEPNSVFEEHNITNLTELTAYAKQIYDDTYPEDAGKYDTEFRNPKNPLNRFVAYHFLDRLGNYNELTVSGDIKLRLNDALLADATDYYETMCPHTLIRCSSPSEGLFINRLGIGGNFTFKGVKVYAPSQTAVDQSAVNGVYHYIDDILCYTVQTRDEVFNTRFRLDATTLSPDFMSSGARGRPGTTTCTGFKSGSVKNWIFNDETLLSVRNRHLIQFWCYQGDEVVLLHQFDFSFKLPPVPEGTYEIRLGYVIMSGRGIIQTFYGSGPSDKPDEITYQPCGIPLDLRLSGTNPAIGWVRDYTMTTAPPNTNYVEANKAIDKALHNRGYMKGAQAVRAYTGSGYTVSRDQGNWIRRILTTAYLSSTEDHYLRFKQVLDNNMAEFAFDYIELCPKSVYASPAGEDTY